MGWGPIPSLGMVGVALGHSVATGASVAFFLWYLRSGRGRLRLRLARFTLDRSLFRDILKVGALACLSPVQSVLAVLIFTSLVARLGIAPLSVEDREQPCPQDVPYFRGVVAGEGHRAALCPTLEESADFQKFGKESELPKSTGVAVLVPANLKPSASSGYP